MVYLLALTNSAKALYRTYVFFSHMINKAILQHCHREGFNSEEIYGAYRIFFGTLVAESRLKILNLLRQGKKNVSAIVEALQMDQTAVSHDLNRLKECGFVEVNSIGKFRYYNLDKKTIKPLMELIDKHMAKFCVHILRNERGDEKWLRKM